MAQLSNTSLINSANLISYYKLEDTTDTKGYSNLSFTTPPSFVTAKYANGAQFGVSTDPAASGVNHNIGSGAFTFCFWFKDGGGFPGNSIQGFFEHRDSSSKVSVTCDYEYNSGTPRIRLLRDKVGIQEFRISYDVTLSSSRFQHIACTYDGSTLKLWVDGIEVASGATSGGGSNAVTTRFKMGVDDTLHLIGTLDDFAIFNTALTQAQIQSLIIDGGGAFLFLLT